MKTRILLAGVLAATSLPALSQDLSPLTVREVALSLKAGAPDNYFPEVAQKAHVQGDASALCTISKAGDLLDCQVTREEPASYRFGDAVLRLASYMRVADKTRRGAPTAGRQFLLSTHFKLPASR